MRLVNSEYDARWWVSTFDLAKRDKSLDYYIKFHLKSHLEYSDDPHIHVFRVNGLKDEVGIFVSSGPACPTTDFFAR